jgi:predicted nucleic acid-binding protein
MILLDTNFLIGSLVPNTPFNQKMRQWLSAREPIGISTIAWAEFLCGPLSPSDATAARALLPNPEPLLPPDAERAADPFNATGRRRGSLADCMIAATCLRLGATLATANVSDFRSFEPIGLRLVQP